MHPRGQRNQPHFPAENPGPWRRGRGRTGWERGGPPNQRGLNFEFIASVSRSSGLDKDGDALKSASVQEDYREFVQEKLQGYWKQYRAEGVRLDAKGEKARVETEGNILIMFRKLREGISSSKRQDSFAIEVYETSLYLSIIFSSSVQTTSILSHLLPDLYFASKETPSPWTVTFSLLHSLVAHYPSQRPFYEIHRKIPPSYGLPPALDSWIKSTARSLHRDEPLQLFRTAQLTQAEDALPPSSQGGGKNPSALPQLQNVALGYLLEAIRGLSRQSSWHILRSAYREFGLPAGDTRTWLTRQLLLHESSGMDIDAWLKAGEANGEIGQKEGVEGRWLVKIKR